MAGQQRRRSLLDHKKIHDALDALKALPLAIGDINRRIDSSESDTMQLKESVNDLINDLIIDVGDLSGRLDLLDTEERPIGVELDPVTTEIAGTGFWPSEKVGINIPYLDFGDDIISHPAFSKRSIAADLSKVTKIRELFTVAKEEGFGVIRFWFYPSLWHTDNRDGSYTEAMISEAEASTEILCDIAREVGVKLVPTLLSFNNWDKDKDQYGAINPLGNENIIHLLERTIIKLGKYGDVVKYVDVINEPEWAISDLEDADPHFSTSNVQGQASVSSLMIRLYSICSRNNLPSTYGSASRKWDNQLPDGDFKDYHNYAWSETYFPAAWAEGGSHVMGETLFPYSSWGEWFQGGKYNLIMYWLEPNDYTASKMSGQVISPDALRTTLQRIKST